MENGTCFQPGLLYFLMFFHHPSGRLSGVDIDFWFCLSVVVVGSWSSVVGCLVKDVDCGCRSVLPLSVPISAPRELLS